MGKDQELLEAARSGNFSTVERILNQRAKKTGPLASLRRGPGPNIQDNSGFTPLHHACLNGHVDIVKLLLSHEASANVVDNKGCTPLHLASWSGRTKIVKILLTHGPSLQSVNYVNWDHENALHSAAQYGHSEIVKLLLENNCYPSVRNIRGLTPLDLACEYGRLHAVQCLLNAHPNILSDVRFRSHTPLHLAAKNGHKHVIKLLLDSGFDINFMAENGTALHEAAMYGKLEVVKLLLDYGVDPRLVNPRSEQTVFDILSDLNTSIAKQIEEVIKDHMTLMKLEIGSSESILQPPPHLNSVFESVTPERCSLSEITPPRQFCSPSLDESLYDIPPPPKPISQSSLRMNSMSSLTSSHSQDSCFDQTSCGSCSPSKCDPSESSVFENNIYQYVEADSLYYEIPPPPSFFSSKRFSDPLQQCPHYETIYGPDCKKEVSFELFDDTDVPSSKRSTMTLKNNYIPMLPASSSGNRPQPPAKPPRKSVSPHSADTKSSSSQRNSCESICFASSELHECPKQSFEQIENSQKRLNCFKSVDPSEYVDMSLVNRSVAAYENHDIICSNGLDVDSKHFTVKSKMCSNSTSGKTSDALPPTFFCEDVHRKTGSFSSLMPSKSTPALHASRHTLDQAVKEFQQQKPIYVNVKKRASSQLPTSPTGYQQPPTPDNPPPSPGTAEIGIHEKIHPVQASKKLSSRDIDTLTDEQLVATIGPHGEFELTLATDNKCISTENDCNPFAGLHHGSVSATRGEKLSKSRTIYENVQIAMDEDRNKIILSSECSDVKGNNCGCLSVMSPFDEKAEWAEIADIMASFGGSITRESRFVESHFAQAFKSESRPSQQCFSCVEQWLSHIGLSKYENILIINGFDDVNFLGGNIIEDADLIEIGIQNEKDRDKLCAFAQKLPSVTPLSRMSDNESFPQSVDEWLNSINLLEYSDNFANNNITDMERALKLWEVELNTVLKISKIGHRKRILASLGDKHFHDIIGTNELDISKLTLDLAELDVVDNVNKKYSMLKGSREATDDSTPDSSSKLYLRIRSPTQLMSDSQYPDMGAQQSNIKAQWCHRPDELVKYSFNYIAKYLGSTLVKELHGLESTRNSIQKLKSSTKDIAKIPDILLSISYSGVKFIDNQTRQLVCEHEIRNIHCACQDADDLHHFAYITKEHQTHNHYCHVFSSYTVDLASEIILTLGQAFEVAYQIAMKEKAEKTWNSDSKNSQVSKDLS